MKDPKININSADEIVIVIPDLDELGIDVENLSEDVNIVIQVEGGDDEIEIIDDEDFIEEPNEWYFDDDPYGIVYYEYPDYGDED